MYKYRRIRRCSDYENDISAQKAFSCQGSRFPGKNEYTRRQEGAGGKTRKRKKDFISIGHRNVAFFSFAAEFLL